MGLKGKEIFIFTTNPDEGSCKMKIVCSWTRFVLLSPRVLLEYRCPAVGIGQQSKQGSCCGAISGIFCVYFLQKGSRTQVLGFAGLGGMK